jgi:hypothetical protein
VAEVLRSKPDARQSPVAPVRYESPFVRHYQPRALALFVAPPLAFTLALAALSAWPSVRAVAPLAGSFRLAAGILLVWILALAALFRRRGVRPDIDVELRKQHYVQACAQLSVLVYWGAYWPPVRSAVPLLVAQLLFAFAFDMLLAASRRRRYTLGFAPVPVVFSINLFLWFKPNWFVYQFAMIALGFAAKEFLRWRKEGRIAHIFNPSSFPLAVASIVLLAAGATGITFGPDIAETQFRAPHIYLALFLIGLPGQFLFGVASMTLAAAATTYLTGLAYFWATGTYFFIDSYIPVGVFLGMHLLFTDPSTSPRTELGRIVFGALYGLGTVVCYAILGRAGLPTFYDKLLPVPILNLTIKAIDAAVRAPYLARMDLSRIGRRFTGRARNLAYIGVWTAVFIGMSAANGVGDYHPGRSVLFWQRACDANRYKACETLAQIEAIYCFESGWACNELGLLEHRGRVAVVDPPRKLFARACELGYGMGCVNVHLLSTASGELRSGSPRFVDYRIILQTGKGPLRERTPIDLYERACADGWMAGCENAGLAYLRGQGTQRIADRAFARFDRACGGGLASACSNAGLMYELGDGIPRDHARALMYLRRACDLGLTDACRSVQQQEATTHVSGR